MKTYFYDSLDLLSDGNAKFLHGVGIDEPLQAETPTGSLSYLQDHLGSTSQLLDATNGTSKKRYDYKSYGKLEGDVTNPASANPFTYTGREDDGTGLMYYRERYYDPELEAFISEDPLGDVQRYVGGNPLSFTDPFGLWGVGVNVGGSAEAGVVAGAGATGSAGAGVFWGGKQGVNTGAFAGGGAFAGWPGFGACTSGKNKNQGVIGAFAGIGGGAFFTNANSASDLSGYGDTGSFNLGIGLVKFGAQYTQGSNGVGALGITVGPGAIFSLSRYGTNTVTTK